MESRIKKGEPIELIDDKGNHILLWFQSKTSRFYLMLNSKVIKSTRTWKPIENRLQQLGQLTECE